MALDSNSAQMRDLSELRNHLKWLDEERRKSGRRMAELEQRLAQQGRELAERDHRIQELERRATATAARLERLPENDSDPVTHDQRLKDLEWHLANLSSQVGALEVPPAEQTRASEERPQTVAAARQPVAQDYPPEQFTSLVARQDEQARLLFDLSQRLLRIEGEAASPAGHLRPHVGVAAGQSEVSPAQSPELFHVEEQLATLAEAQAHLELETSRQIAPLLTSLEELRTSVAHLNDDLRRNRMDISRQVEAWQLTIDEQKDIIERFTEQWISLSNQYKEARMAAQSFAHWQKQLEQQKREAAEQLRVESNRLQGRWHDFLFEIDARLKSLDRDELMQALRAESRDMLWRVHAAQVEAIRQWPRMLMEEVARAVEPELIPRPAAGHTPLESGGSAAAREEAAPIEAPAQEAIPDEPVREVEPDPLAILDAELAEELMDDDPGFQTLPSDWMTRLDLSVIDAIEQGLIQIDYDDDESVQQ